MWSLCFSSCRASPAETHAHDEMKNHDKVGCGTNVTKKLQSLNFWTCDMWIAKKVGWRGCAVHRFFLRNWFSSGFPVDVNPVNPCIFVHGEVWAAKQLRQAAASTKDQGRTAKQEAQSTPFRPSLLFATTAHGHTGSRLNYQWVDWQSTRYAFLFAFKKLCKCHHVSQVHWHTFRLGNWRHVNAFNPAGKSPPRMVAPDHKVGVECYDVKWLCQGPLCAASLPIEVMRSSRLLAYDEGRCIGLAACTLSTEIGKPAALIPQNLLEVESTYHHIEPAGWCLSLKPILPIAVWFVPFKVQTKPILPMSLLSNPVLFLWHDWHDPKQLRMVPACWHRALSTLIAAAKSVMPLKLSTNSQAAGGISIHLVFGFFGTSRRLFLWTKNSISAFWPSPEDSSRSNCHAGCCKASHTFFRIGTCRGIKWSRE